MTRAYSPNARIHACAWLITYARIKQNIPYAFSHRFPCRIRKYNIYSILYFHPVCKKMLPGQETALYAFFIFCQKLKTCQEFLCYNSGHREKRRKTMNIILLLSVILCSMFMVILFCFHSLQYKSCIFAFGNTGFTLIYMKTNSWRGLCVEKLQIRF